MDSEVPSGAKGATAGVDSAPGLARGRPSTRPERQRIPLGRTRKRLSYDLRLRIWLMAASISILSSFGLFLWVEALSVWSVVALLTVAALVLAALGAMWFEQMTRPLQTLSNVVAALREDDFSFRARGARRGDTLGDLALEINSLAGSLQGERGAARDALTLAERVMTAMPTPVLAFSEDGVLRLLNPAAASAFRLEHREAIGRPCKALGLEPMLALADGAVHARPATSNATGETRWAVRRSGFRLGGVPHHLLVLSDVNAALREEERTAWQRLIRVLSHEINNSLTPITSIAGSLRSRIPAADTHGETLKLPVQDLRRGLQLIEERALSLHHFLQSYQQLARLPRPKLQRVTLSELVQRVVSLETRLQIVLRPGGEVALLVDPAQIEQLAINLLRNAVEAAMGVSSPNHTPQVTVAWSVAGAELVLRIEDNGLGLSDTANLFVPFYTTKPEGSGIGLALAKQIAAGHGATLTLANRPDVRGCVAELRLPLNSTQMD